jgi:hypothetical protein
MRVNGRELPASRAPRPVKPPTGAPLCTRAVPSSLVGLRSPWLPAPRAHCLRAAVQSGAPVSCAPPWSRALGWLAAAGRAPPRTLRRQPRPRAARGSPVRARRPPHLASLARPAAGRAAGSQDTRQPLPRYRCALRAPATFPQSIARKSPHHCTAWQAKCCTANAVPTTHAARNMLPSIHRASNPTNPLARMLLSLSPENYPPMRHDKC